MTTQGEERKPKMKMLISFSGGETSAFMAWWLHAYKKHEFEFKCVFANTGEENEETLDFINNFSKNFKIPIIWIETVEYHGQRKAPGFRIVNFKSASRKGEPFEDVIKKHGIPNQNTPHCTRELKQKPIEAYMKSIGWGDAKIAIGIRADEADRINKKAKELGLVYPLITNMVIKPQINIWWNSQSFRLKLKGYQGNCKTCWKKSLNKLKQIAIESPEKYDFMRKMENEYGTYIPETRKKLILGRGDDLPQLPFKFFRGNRSVAEILHEAYSTLHAEVKDDSIVYDYQIDLIGGDGESCEVFSECKDN